MIERRVLQRGFLWGWFLAAALSSIVPAAELPALDKEAAAKTSFRRDVWPIVKRHCWGCHSGAEPKGGLNMSTVQDMLKGGDSGTALTAGKPDDSLLIESITGEEPEMPKDKPPLSVAKIQILRHWILAGAKDDSPPGANQAQVNIPEVYKHAPSVTSVSFSPDGKLLAAVGGSPAQFGEVTFFNPADGAVVSKRRVTYDTLFRGNFAPDGKAIAVGGADGAVHVVPVDAKADVRSFDLHSDWVLDVAYTPDGKMLVSGGRDKATKVCSVETGQLLRSIDSSSELISSVAADEQFAVASGKARALTSYELKTALSGIEVTGSGNGARPISKLAQYTKQFEAQPGEVFDIAMSGDRKRIAVGGAYGEVRIYTTADQKRVAVVNGLTAPIYSVALNADGSRLAVGSRDGRVQIFSLPDAKPLKSLVPVPVAAAGS